MGNGRGSRRSSKKTVLLAEENELETAMRNVTSKIVDIAGHVPHETFKSKKKRAKMEASCERAAVRVTMTSSEWKKQKKKLRRKTRKNGEGNNGR